MKKQSAWENEQIIKSQSKSKSNDPIVRRLDALVRLMLEEQRARDAALTIGDQISVLESVGLGGKDVAGILGIHPSQLSSYRRYAKKGKKPKNEARVS